MEFHKSGQKSMNDTAQPTPTRDITIQKNIYTIPQPYCEGHVLTAVEAKQLNQTWSEGVRNNMAPKIKAAIEAAEAGDADDMKKVKAEVKTYANQYVFTLAGTGRTKMDPLEKEARRIARINIVAYMESKGRKVADLDKDKLANEIIRIAENPKIRKQAKARIAEQFALAEDELGDISL